MADWDMACGQWNSPALEDLLPDLSREEQQRLQDRLREHDRILKRQNKISPPLPPSLTERERDASIILPVHHALRHYNARHPGGEFDPVKPLMSARVVFRGQAWFHVNFWARSRSSTKIKRFFAEVHYKPSTTSIDCSIPIPIVEICTIIEEPLCQYKRSCAFCLAQFDILHPKGCRKFVCGNDKDRIEQRLVKCVSQTPEMPFTCPTQMEKDPKAWSEQEEVEEQDAA